MTEVVYCGCNGKYQKRNKVHHLSTKKHQTWLELQYIVEQFTSIEESADIVEPFVDETTVEDKPEDTPLTTIGTQFSFGVSHDTKRIFIDFESKTLLITTEGANGPTNIKICVDCSAIVV